MKYRCDMVRDLMPLCLDHEATKDSEQTVIEHLAECKECSEYYVALGKELESLNEQDDRDAKYVLLAAKIRKRKKIIGAVISIILLIQCIACLGYALGFRLSPKAAADKSGALNNQAELIASFEWKANHHFYIYDSHSFYNVIPVERTLLGWKRIESVQYWPKWSWYDETVGIETAGTVCYYKYDEGVELFPIIPYDTNIKTVEVTCYGETQTKEVKTGEVTLFTFDANHGQDNTIEANAYDASGKIIYRYEKQGKVWGWMPVTE